MANVASLVNYNVYIAHAVEVHDLTLWQGKTSSTCRTLFK